MSQVDSMYQIAEQISAQTPGPRPWVRYFARTIDHGFVFGLSAVVVGAAVAMGMRPGLPVKLLWHGLNWVGWLPIEAVLLSTWGTTPGKALLRVRLRTNTGDNLNFFQALSRAGGVWVRGQGCGVPLVSFITCIVAYNNLMGDRITSWDREGGTTVEHGPCGPGRMFRGWLLGAAAMIALLLCGGMLASRGLPPGTATDDDTTPTSGSGSAYQALVPLQPRFPTTISLPSKNGSPGTSDPSQAIAGTWVASSSTTSGNQKLALTTALVLNADGTFRETLHCTDTHGVVRPDLGHELSGTWDLNGERLIQHVTSTSTRRHPAGSWVYDLTTTGPDAMQLRRISAPASYANSGHKPLLTFQRRQATARTE